LTDNQIDHRVENLLELFPQNISSREEFVAELQYIRTLMNGQRKNFSTFSEMAKWILNVTDDSSCPHLHFFLSLILVLPFCTADCERSFSAMNFLKSKIRNRLKEILKSLMLLYTAPKDDIKKIDLKKVATTVATKVWSRNKRPRWNASEDYNCLNFFYFHQFKYILEFNIL